VLSAGQKEKKKRFKESGAVRANQRRASKVCVNPAGCLGIIARLFHGLLTALSRRRRGRGAFLRADAADPDAWGGKEKGALALGSAGTSDPDGSREDWRGAIARRSPSVAN